jgi:uncharacterized protein YjbI with pentapeptide repeats
MATCSYTSEDLAAPQHSAENITIPDDWSCSHDAVTGKERCMFHLSPEERTAIDISEQEVSTAARELAVSAEKHADLVGAQLSELDLAGSVVTGNPGEILDLRYSTIQGVLLLSDALVEVPINAEGAVIGGGIELNYARFDNRVSFYGSRVKGTIEGTSVRFEKDATFARILASFSVRLRDSTVFEKMAVFSKLKIKGKRGSLDLRSIIAKGPLYCRHVDIPGIKGSDAILEGPVGMAGAQIQGDADFSGAHFHANTAFGDSDRKQFDEKTTIEGKTDFSAVLAHQSVSFDGVKFKGQLDFSDASFMRKVQFRLATFRDSIDLDGAEFTQRLVFKPQYVDSSEDRFKIRATETVLQNAELAQPGQTQSQPIYFDFVGATLGDVDFLDTTLDGKPVIQDNYTYSSSTLETVRFLRTRFEGFDFTSYRTAFEDDWNLHEFDSADQTISRTLSPGDLELTYMYGKRGANNIGDNLAAAEFFKREMSYRTDRYRPRSNSDSDRPLKYVGLRLWGLTNYTESPLRVFLLGVGGAILFAGVYGGLATAGIGNTPYPEAPLLGHIVFSFESLITLVHDPGATVDSMIVRVFSLVEGFFGAFLIALFVFSLTRAVHR